MDLFRSKLSNSHEPLDDERPAKRISTPAGKRLSLIVESHHTKRSKSPAATKINVTTTSTYCNDPTHQHIEPVQHAPTPKSTKFSGMVSALTGGRLATPRESCEGRTPNGSALSVSVWSEKDAEKFGQIRQTKRGVANRPWKKIAIIVAVVLALIIALAVGLAVGLKKKTPSSSSNDAHQAGSQPGTSTTPDTAAPASTVKPAELPAGFPVGTFSIITFLDTVTTNCTANPATWTCPPNTNYYSDPQKALTILNWEISGATGSYKISSKGQDATFGTSFQNEKLTLVDAGKDSERYIFQLSRSKTVNMTGTLGDKRGEYECDFGATGIQGSLYTKMARTYPKDNTAVGETGNPSWPFAARVEQNVGGGEGIPSCKSKWGDVVTDGLKAQDAGTLCSCMYKNWTPQKL